jgi:signal transduction histidine kinase
MTRLLSGWKDLAVYILPRSIAGWFAICWCAFLLGSVMVGMLLLSLYRQTTTERLRHASAAVAHGCEAIKDQYRFFTVNRSLAPNNLHAPELAEGLTGVVKNALRGLPDIEGGIWQTEQGSLAYAFPTYEGTGEKTDLPPAEEPSIREAAETATFANAPFERRKDSRSQTLLLHSCPLPGPIPHLVAWTMTRVTTAGGRAFAQAMAGLGILLAVVLGSATWLGRLLFSWSRQLRQLESALASSAGELPKLVLTGQRDLDRIVDSLNRAGARLAAARSAADALARQVAENERLASLGRVVAGIAHEIRNPIAAMRLKAENAVAAGPDLARKDRALQTIVEQIQRLETLLQNLLSSVQRASPQPVLVKDLAAFLEKRADLFREQAAAEGLALEVRGSRAAAVFDAPRMAQAIDNLILNAIENTAPGGRVTLCAESSADQLIFSIADTGRGVPDSIWDHLFEPFVSGRSEGTGPPFRDCRHNLPAPLLRIGSAPRYSVAP